ncbi:MAG: MFS transporter [Gemmataceae bacterium]|nr:MFS transporter [Gemmataceae bacterium]MCI0741000.1 MFS transporter [Gemmataceae bacterium]
MATHVRYIVLVWMCVFAMVMYIHRNCLAVPAQTIQGQLGISATDMGWAMSMFFWGYAIFQLPGGWIGDRWGSRYVLPVLLIVSSVATGLMSLASGALLLIVARLVMGAAQAGTFPCAVLTFGQWFPKSERAFPNGMLASFMSVGAVLSSALIGLLLDWDLSWQLVFFLFSLPGLFLGLWFFSWFRERPRDHSAVGAEELQYIEAGQAQAAQTPKEPLPWRKILTDPNMGCICGQQFFRAAGYNIFLTWFPTFLQVTRNVDESVSGYLTSLPLIGVVIGSAAGGLVTDWIFRRTGSATLSRKGVALFCLLVCAGLMASAYFVEQAILCVLIVSLGMVFAGACGPSSYTVTIDLGGKHVATVFSLMNMSGNIGAALLPVAVVQFEQWVQNLKLSDPALYPTFEEWLQYGVLIPDGWNEVLFFLAGLYVAAALFWVFVRLDKKATT